jgi:hypothetical protein
MARKKIGDLNEWLRHMKISATELGKIKGSQ